MYGEVTVRLEIWPSPPDEDWWNSFLEMAKERRVKFAVDPTPDGIVALAKHNVAVRSAVLAIDSAIAYANDCYNSRIEQNETELDKIADELEEPDPRQEIQ
jgi:hypothetical protein